MGRLGSLLRGGVRRCDVAVLYPIRTAWLDFLPHTPKGHPAPPLGDAARRMDVIGRLYADTVRDLLRCQIDCDIIDEQALVEGDVANGGLRVADESFRVIVLPGCEAISASAATALAAFGRTGGLVMSVGPPPRLGESAAAATETVKAEMSRLFATGGGGVAVAPADLVERLRQANCAVLDLAAPDRDIPCTQRELDGRGLRFIVNAGAEPRCLRPAARLRQPLDLYRPLDGSIGAFPPGSEPALDSLEGAFLVERPAPRYAFRLSIISPAKERQGGMWTGGGTDTLVRQRRTEAR